MDAVAVQAEIKDVIDILKDAKKSKVVTGLDSAIDRLSALHKQVAAKTGPRLAGNPGGEPLFHRNDKF